jgi:hypothetical protein
MSGLSWILLAGTSAKKASSVSVAAAKSGAKYEVVALAGGGKKIVAVAS